MGHKWYGMDLTEAEDIKNSWQEYTEELYKKYIHEVSQKDKDHYSILTHIYGIQKDGNDNPICKTEKETQMYRGLWEKARVGCLERRASKHVYYLG